MRRADMEGDVRDYQAHLEFKASGVKPPRWPAIVWMQIAVDAAWWIAVICTAILRTEIEMNGARSMTLGDAGLIGATLLGIVAGIARTRQRLVVVRALSIAALIVAALILIAGAF